MQEEEAGEVDAETADLCAIRADVWPLFAYARRRVADGFSPNFVR